MTPVVSTSPASGTSSQSSRVAGRADSAASESFSLAGKSLSEQVSTEMLWETGEGQQHPAIPEELIELTEFTEVEQVAETGISELKTLDVPLSKISLAGEDLQGVMPIDLPDLPALSDSAGGLQISESDQFALADVNRVSGLNSGLVVPAPMAGQMTAVSVGTQGAFTPVRGLANYDSANMVNIGNQQNEPALLFKTEGSNSPLIGQEQVNLQSALYRSLTQSQSNGVFTQATSASPELSPSLPASMTSGVSQSAAQTQNTFLWQSESLGEPSSWGKKLIGMLGDKVQLQVGQQLQKAHIRLDPPQLGSIEISISVEHDKTTVHLTASHGQVKEAMMQTLEQLRQSLAGRLGTEVDVQTGEGHRQSSQERNANSRDHIATQWQDDIETTKTEHANPNAWLDRLA